MHTILKGPIQFFDPPDDKSGGGDHLAEQEHEKEGGKKADAEPKKGDADYEKRKADFNAKFGASSRASTQEGGKPDNEPNKQHVEQHVEDQKKAAEVREEDKKRAEAIQKGDKPKPFVKQQIEAKRTAEHERDELKTELGETKKQIEELTKKLESGDYSNKKEAEFQKKIVELETKSKEQHDALVNENDKLKKQVEFYNLQDSSDFQEKFLKPVQNSYSEAVSVIGEDKVKMDAFNQALISNGAALRAKTTQERQQLENQRDQILSQILDGMSAFSANRFTTHVNNYIQAAFEHAKALASHEQTTSQIREERKKVAQRGYTERLNTWGKTFEATAANYDTKVQFDDEEKKLAKELGHDVDAELQKSRLLASKTVVGDVEIEDAMDLIHNGRILPAALAKIEVLKKRVSERDDLIKKLRGGGPSGGDGEKIEENKKETREQWQTRKFGAGRVAVKT